MPPSGQGPVPQSLLDKCPRSGKSSIGKAFAKDSSSKRIHFLYAGSPSLSDQKRRTAQREATLSTLESTFVFLPEEGKTVVKGTGLCLGFSYPYGGSIDQRINFLESFSDFRGLFA